MALDLQIDAIGLPALILNLPQTASNITINGSGNLEGYMKKKIVVLDTDQNSSEELVNMLNSKNYPFTQAHSLSSLKYILESDQYVAVILDIDSVPVDNRTIRQLALKHTGVRFLCTSKDRFHPELKDAICYHIYACLNKPVDPDELIFWIKSIYEEEDIPDS
jgi:DNA-binding NtrC family response regulator